MNSTHYTYIFAGGGLSGLTLAHQLAQQPAFRHQKILMIDRDDKTRNDRTWCFWATENELLPPVIYKTWDTAFFFGQHFERKLQLAPYRYCMIRGIDYYNWVKQQLSQYPNITRIQTNIHHISPEKGIVSTDVGDFSGDWILNSAFSSLPLLPEGHTLFPKTPFSVQAPSMTGQQSLTQADMAARHPSRTFLLQHFKGCIIETPDNQFNAEEMTLMDYRIEQNGETRFVYVLPLSERRALVEFTIFSEKMSPPEVYDQVLEKYIKEQLKIKNYQVEASEFGIIPMTDWNFGALQTGKMINIGTGAGFVKASSGYAFLRTQRKLSRFALDWAAKGVPNTHLLRSQPRFAFYDRILLRVLRNGHISGKTIFSKLFQNTPTALILRFLDEDTSMADDFKIINIFPKIPFLKALWQSWTGK